MKHITTTSPFFTALIRDGIGFDPLSQFADAAQLKYPPHNIFKMGEYRYTLTMAIAGFKKDQIAVTVDDGYLTVEGRSVDDETPEGYEELYRGISNRDFDRTWKLGEYVEVVDVKLEDGMLKINLERKVPESKKARVIDIE